MTCYHPISAYYPLKPDSEGKRHLKFGRSRNLIGFQSAINCWQSGYNFDFARYETPYDYPIYFGSNMDLDGLNIKIPCGKCIGCRLDYSRMWATRSVHEAYMSDYYRNCAFLTLTFSPEMLNRRENPYSLNKVAFRSWIKRLRKAIKAQYNVEFRIMACGEYGAKRSRPHYHMLIYGFNFPDKYVWKYNKVHGKEVLYYRSPFLESIWRPAHCKDSFGFSVIGEVNFETSAYVARYVTKKLFGSPAKKVYKDLEKEFLTTSRMPGLGFSYLEKFYQDIFNHGYITLPSSHKAPIPRYYLEKLKTLDVDLYTKYTMDLFNKRIDNLFQENIEECEQRRLAKEELHNLRLDMLVRQYEFN